MDQCPNGDKSPSYYDKSCDAGSSTTTKELGSAYDFALENELTKLFPIDNARAYDSILRYEAAITLENFATNILKKSPDTSKNCSFSDLGNMSASDKESIKRACQFGIMGLKANGLPDSIFNPYMRLSREMFLTTLSRVLYGDKYNTKPGEPDTMWSTHHVQKLRSESIVTQTDANKLKSDEMRGYVWIMLQRAAKILGIK
jgi:hypothetical protein